MQQIRHKPDAVDETDLAIFTVDGVPAVDRANVEIRQYYNDAVIRPKLPSGHALKAFDLPDLAGPQRNLTTGFKRDQGDNPTTPQHQAYLEAVLLMLEDLAYLERYAYYNWGSNSTLFNGDNTVSIIVAWGRAERRPRFWRRPQSSTGQRPSIIVAWGRAERRPRDRAGWTACSLKDCFTV